MIMTVNCRFLKPLDFASRDIRAVYADGFQRLNYAPRNLPSSLALIARSYLFGRIFWAFVNFL
jgi:hypothetical protein